MKKIILILLTVAISQTSLAATVTLETKTKFKLSVSSRITAGLKFCVAEVHTFYHSHDTNKLDTRNAQLTCDGDILAKVHLFDQEFSHQETLSTLIEIINDQKQLKWTGNISRDKINKIPVGDEIDIISGVRRCGKSTLLREIKYNNTEQDYYIDFDDERLIHFTVDNFQLFPFSFKEYLKLKKFNVDENITYSTNGKAKIKELFFKYFIEGGFPEYLKTGNKDYLKIWFLSN